MCLELETFEVITWSWKSSMAQLHVWKLMLTQLGVLNIAPTYGHSMWLELPYHGAEFCDGVSQKQTS